MRTRLGLAAAIALAAPLCGAGAAQPAPAGAMPGMQGMAAAEAPCPATPAPLPAEFAGWATQPPLAAAGSAAAAAGAELAIGRAATLRLLATPAVAYPARPGHPGGSATSGGIAGFTVVAPGTYHVALGTGAWIDVVAGGRALVSTAHGHGPACSGIRKMVDFALVPGRYLLQVAGADTPTLAVMVTRAR